MELLKEFMEFFGGIYIVIGLFLAPGFYGFCVSCIMGFGSGIYSLIFNRKKITNSKKVATVSSMIVLILGIIYWIDLEKSRCEDCYMDLTGLVNVVVVMSTINIIGVIWLIYFIYNGAKAKNKSKNNLSGDKSSSNVSKKFILCSFIYNDKIYYFKYILDNENKEYTEFYSTDLDNNNKRIITILQEIGNIIFYFVYNNNAYLRIEGKNKKIDLGTGEIIDLKNNSIFYLSNTLKENLVNSFISNNEGYSLFRKINLQNNEVLQEVKINRDISKKEYIFDYDNTIVYYLENFYSPYPTIYKNNDVICEFKENKTNIKFIAVKDKYLYYKMNKYIYKLNTITKEVDKKIEYNLGNLKKLNSSSNNDNYFIIDNRVYLFDLENDSFKFVLNNIDKDMEKVYNVGNKLIFIGKKVVIYDKKVSKEVKRNDGVEKVFFDDKGMYVLYSKGNSVDKISL